MRDYFPRSSINITEATLIHSQMAIWCCHLYLIMAKTTSLWTGWFFEEDQYYVKTDSIPFLTHTYITYDKLDILLIICRYKPQQKKRYNAIISGFMLLICCENLHRGRCKLCLKSWIRVSQEGPVLQFQTTFESKTQRLIVVQNQIKQIIQGML